MQSLQLVAILWLFASLSIALSDIDCSNAHCRVPTCASGWIPMVPNGDCCPVCLPAPAEVPANQACPESPIFGPCVLPGGCKSTIVPQRCACPICADGCDDVDCPDLDCGEGSIPIFPGGHCCPICSPSFPGTTPPFPTSPTQATTQSTPSRPPTPPTVPTSEPPSTSQCPVPGMVVVACAKPCIPTCENPHTSCSSHHGCFQGCACPEGHLMDTKINRCVPREQCPGGIIECPIEGQQFTFCQTCPITCGQLARGETITCTQCRPGCGCSYGMVIDEINGRCVSRDQCPGSSTEPSPTTATTTAPTTSSSTPAPTTTPSTTAPTTTPSTTAPTTTPSTTAPTTPEPLVLPDTCPPECSHAFCGGQGKSLCTVLTRDSGTCTSDECPFPVTHCRVRYYSQQEREEPLGCRKDGCTDQDFTGETKCMRQWSLCTRRADRAVYGSLPQSSEQNETLFKIYFPSCQ